VHILNKTLLVYYTEHHHNNHKPTNEDKVALELKRLFEEKKYTIDVLPLESTKKLHLKDQFKKEKEIELKTNIPNLSNYKCIIIGTPIVGAMTSSPIINSFIRQIKFEKTNSKPQFAIYSTGIMHGFELKKMTSLLSMKGIKPINSECFSSMFDFDSKKLNEVKLFFDRFIELI
jgi:flavodoxin